MPYLRKKPFQRLHVSSDYKDDDEVFHCEVTNEVFKDYNEYCERIILCNSTIWSCSITGKTNMTYEEAVACEENAKKSLKEFPMELRTPILYLASKTNRTSFSEMTDDVFQYARDRYFVGEMVEANLNNDVWCDCHILQVIEPTEAQLKEYTKENSQERQYYPPAKLFRYEVEQMDGDVNQIMIVEASRVRRKKLLYSRERNRIFLRMLCEQNSKGVWIVKESIQQKYSIPKVRFDTIFSGPLPDFNLPKKSIVKQKQVTLDKFLTSDVSKHRAFEKPDSLNKINSGGIQVKKNRKPRMNGKYSKEHEAKVKEEKEKRKEQRNEMRERKKEEKQKLAVFAAYVREWNKPREDLECEDLRPITEATPVDCAIPNKNFGDFAMILEFLQFFYEELEVNSYFPGGLALETLEKALLVKEVSGPWSDLLQLLLANIFKYQAQEEDEIHESNSKIDNINFDHGVSSMAEAVKLATRASTWCQTHHGCQLSELTLDHVTLSEILRQHLLSSGGRIGEAASKWRYSERGGYTNHDDPALLLRINQPRLLRLLGHRSVCEFDLDDRLCVTTCLINQLLTFAAMRDVIDERYEKVHQARRELKSLIVAEQKKEKEEKERIKEREKDGKVDGDKSVDEKADDKPKKTRGSREEEKQREKYEQQLLKLKQASKDDQMMLYLGSDRAHRRYWRLLSIPGVFVENDEKTPGSCLTDGTPYLPELQDKDSADKYLKNKFEDEVSDKENNINEAKTSQVSKKTVTFADTNGIKKLSTRELNDIRKKLMACTDDKDCPVHCKRPETKWSFYGRPEDIEAVMNNLSIRGLREGELRNNINQEIESLKSVINNCPKHKLNSKVFPQPSQETAGKSTKKVKNENTNLNYPPDVAIDEVMELSLRDFILELEDKIKVGCLGTLKIKDRDAWRNAITNCQYDKQCDKLVYGQHEIEADVPINSALDKIKSETRQSSRPGTPDSEAGSGVSKSYQDPGKYLGPPDEGELVADSKQQMRIRQMACAILQLSHAVEHRYLKKPLGHDDKDKKHSTDEAKERWEHSLMMSTSWSQLFIHLNTLESSIAWSRSALNARCRICRKCRDAEHMLLCDGCNKGHHLYCLKPKLTSVPEGDWFCTTCKPPETKSKPKNKKRRRFEDEDEEEGLTKDTRHSRSRRILSSDDEADDETTNADDTLVEEKPKFRELCSICGNSGSVIACDTCIKLYHIDCLDPPLSRAPRGRWSCYECRNIRKNASRRARGRERVRDRERSCAAAARFRIHSFAKSLLRTETYNWDDSSASEETDVRPRQTRRATKRAAADQDKTLHELLKEVMHHKESWPFLSPVTANEVPDYHEFIKHPMDFGTVKKKLDSGFYENNSHLFFADCLLIFDNCQTYNQQNSTVYNYVYRAGMRLAKFFEKRSKEMGFNYDEETAKLPAAKRIKLENGDADHSTENGLQETKVNGDS
ncbi:bromodomain adjacent to zinc finger domain protein 1A isoform X1 [Microplitis demolitor]|uniref:bromodomain adjacent to zinc finger domain protein 1A isoform X1 n=1 Tax=Microplitis demolitor TaxID=69319 RepID=UPI0004CD34AA|nr:bromodomain adjacent to zinc finger domain protein 1A isoform X1 [Microplitis demolitor]